jgi:hypothetical protein
MKVKHYVICISTIEPDNPLFTQVNCFTNPEPAIILAEELNKERQEFEIYFSICEKWDGKSILSQTCLLANANRMI